MVNLYRYIRSPSETLITFNGTPEDVARLAEILGFTPRKSTLNNNVERGYYAYVREPNRRERENRALAYLSSHFTPPSIELLLFKSTAPHPPRQNREEWIRQLEREILNCFRRERYLIDSNCVNKICRKDPVYASGDLAIYEGVIFRIYIREDRYAEMQVDVSYLCQLKGKNIHESQMRALLTLQRGLTES